MGDRSGEARRGCIMPGQERGFTHCYETTAIMPHNPDIVIKPRDVMPEGALTLPAEYYVDQAFFRREMEMLFGRMWICSGRSTQIEAPGQFFLRELPGESVILVRAPSGRVNALYNVCRHRGTKLC